MSRNPKSEDRPAAVDARAEEAKHLRTQDLADLALVLAEPHGRRLVWRLLTMSGVFRSSFTGNSTTFFNEGRREVGLEILADVHEVGPDRYVEMMREAQRDERAAERRVEAKTETAHPDR